MGRRFIFGILLMLSCGSYLSAQKLVVYGSKVFSNDVDINKAFAVGGDIVLDHLKPFLEINLGGEYGWYNENTRSGYGNSTALKRIRGGIGVYYKKTWFDKLNLTVGPEINFFNIKNKTASKTDSSYYYVVQTGYMLGCGVGLEVNYQLTSVFGLGLHVSPSYLVSLKGKCDKLNVEILYKKGVFACDIRLNLIFKLNPSSDIKENINKNDIN